MDIHALLIHIVVAHDISERLEVISVGWKLWRLLHLISQVVLLRAQVSGVWNISAPASSPNVSTVDGIKTHDFVVIRVLSCQLLLLKSCRMELLKLPNSCNILGSCRINDTGVPGRRLILHLLLLMVQHEYLRWRQVWRLLSDRLLLLLRG
jgi:hypothetical protein